MIGYVTVGSKDIERAAKFYDALLGSINARRYMESERFVAWFVSPTQPSFGVITPFNGEPACVGNGSMTAFVMDSPEKVDAFYALAMSLGATDEGGPGLRGGNFYAAYFRDLDGNKLNAFCMK